MWCELSLEMLLEIASYLSPGDLCNLALVCTGLNKVAVHPSLWRNFTINMREVVNRGFDHLSRVKRFSQSSLDLSLCDLRNESIDHITAAVVNFRIVDFLGAKLTAEQMNKMFSDLSRTGPGAMEKLLLNLLDLHEVPVHHLVDVVVGMKSIGFNDATLTEEQLTGILTLMVDQPQATRIEKMKIRRVGSPGESFRPDGNGAVKKVDSGLLARAMGRLTRLEIGPKAMTSKQLNDFFTHVGNLEKNCLKTLDVTNENMSEVSGQILSKAVLKIREVSFSQQVLSRNQLMAVFTGIVNTPNKLLEHIYFSGDRADLNSVPEKLLAEAVVNVKYVTMFLGSVTKAQVGLFL